MYRIISPPDYLKQYVQYFWILESDNMYLSPVTMGPLVDGCPGLMLQKAEKGFYADDNKKLPEIFLYGQTVSRTHLYFKGKFETLGVTFFPNALKTVFGFDAFELTDFCCRISLLTDKRHNYLEDKLLNSQSFTNQIEALTSYLFFQIRKNEQHFDPLIGYAQSEIILLKGNVSLLKIQKILNMSERSLERKFRQHVGISPKLFSRINRFQEAFRLLKNNNYIKLSDIAFDAGYTDQSHFIREFREFTGLAPYQYQKEFKAINEDFPILIK